MGLYIKTIEWALYVQIQIDLKPVLEKDIYSEMEGTLTLPRTILAALWRGKFMSGKEWIHGENNSISDECSRVGTSGQNPTVRRLVTGAAGWPSSVPSSWIPGSN